MAAVKTAAKQQSVAVADANGVASNKSTNDKMVATTTTTSSEAPKANSAEVATIKAEVQALEKQMAADKATNTKAASTAKASFNSIKMILNGMAALKITGVLDQLKAQIATANGDGTDTNPGITEALNQLTNGSSELLAGANKLSSQSPDLVSGIMQINTGLHQLNDQVPTLVNGITQLYDGSKTLVANNKTLMDGQTQLNDGLIQLNSQVPTLTNAIGMLANGSATLNKNSGALNSGAKQLSTGLGQLNKQVPVLTSAIGKLAAGSTTENDGMQSLNGQVPTLVNGVHKLANGSGQLNTGLQSLNGQVPTLVSGVSKLANGSSQLDTGLGTLQSSTPALQSGVKQLADGGSQLSTGLNTLNSSTGALIDGAKQLDDGASQLDANSGKLNGGTGQLINGDNTLSTSLQGGADQVKAVPLNNKMAQMFAAPTNVKRDSTNYVPNFGFAMAPFVISLLTLLGVTAIAAIMARITGFNTKRSIYETVGLAGLQGFVTTAVIIMILKQIDHPIQFVILGILLSVITAMIEIVLFKYLKYWAFLLVGAVLGTSVFFSNDIYPSETINSLSDYLGLLSPVHYTNLALRQCLTGGIDINVGGMIFLLIMGILVLTLWLIYLMGNKTKPQHAAEN